MEWLLATVCEIKQANIQHHSSSQARISHKLSLNFFLFFFSKTQNPMERAAESFPCIPNCPLNGLMGSINAHKLSAFSLSFSFPLFPYTSLLTLFLPLSYTHTHQKRCTFLISMSASNLFWQTELDLYPTGTVSSGLKWDREKQVYKALQDLQGLVLDLSWRQMTHYLTPSGSWPLSLE